MDALTFGGHDSLTTSIHSLFLIRIHSELDDVFSDDTDRHVTKDVVKQLTYLDCVIKEASRMFPYVSVFMRHMSDVVTIGEHRILKGTDVVFAGLQMRQYPKIFPEPFNWIRIDLQGNISFRFTMQHLALALQSLEIEDVSSAFVTLLIAISYLVVLVNNSEN